MSTASFTKQWIIYTDEAAEVLIQGAEEQDRRGPRPRQEPVKLADPAILRRKADALGVAREVVHLADQETINEWASILRSRAQRRQLPD
jgi:hypothetical protein